MKKRTYGNLEGRLPLPKVGTHESMCYYLACGSSLDFAQYLVHKCIYIESQKTLLSGYCVLPLLILDILKYLMKANRYFTSGKFVDLKFQNFEEYV